MTTASPGTTNRSIVTLKLTPAGRTPVKNVTTRRRRELSRALNRLDPAERTACARALRSLHQQLGDGYAEHLRGPMPL